MHNVLSASLICEQNEGTKQIKVCVFSMPFASHNNWEIRRKAKNVCRLFKVIKRQKSRFQFYHHERLVSNGRLWIKPLTNGEICHSFESGSDSFELLYRTGSYFSSVPVSLTIHCGSDICWWINTGFYFKGRKEVKSLTASLKSWICEIVFHLRPDMVVITCCSCVGWSVFNVFSQIVY